ncbi:MAG: hypothetical protein SWO11_23635 [Thermodesulfobacteriota bacterium]|nr:hypothetical protein [Thermodesulfobacteriota bacterium]
MKLFWTWLSSVATSPLFSVASFVLAVVGVILTIHFYRKGRRQRAISYARQSDTLVEDLSDRFPKLLISFGGENISALTVSRIAVWNSGTESIRGNDISQSDPLRIILPEGTKLLSSEITSKTKEANSFSLHHDVEGNVITLSFEYVDPDDGIVINLIHSGSKRDPEVRGSVVGVSRLTHRTASFSLSSRSRRHRRFGFHLYMTISMGGFGAAIIALAIWSDTLIAKILIALLGGVYVLAGLLMPLGERDSLPKGLQILDESQNDGVSPNKANSADAKSHAAD